MKLVVSLLNPAESFSTLQATTATIIDQHCGDVVRKLESKYQNVEIVHRRHNSRWYGELNNQTTLLYVGFVCFFMLDVLDNATLYQALKQVAKIFVWFDDLDAYKLETYEDWKSWLPVFRDLNVTILHPCQDQVPLLLPYIDATYVNWCAPRLELVGAAATVLPKASDILIIFLDYDHRCKQSVSTHDAIVEAILKLCEHIPIRVHCPVAIPTHPNLTSTHGSLSYTDMIRYLQSSHVYITSIRGSYEFTVLESQLCDNWVIEYGNCLRSEHKSENTISCNNPVELFNACLQAFKNAPLTGIAKNKYGVTKALSLLEAALPPMQQRVHATKQVVVVKCNKGYLSVWSDLSFRFQPHYNTWELWRFIDSNHIQSVWKPQVELPIVANAVYVDNENVSCQIIPTSTCFDSDFEIRVRLDYE